MTGGSAFPRGPEPAPIESKVKWSAAGAYIGTSVAVYVLELIMGEPVLVTPLPDALEPLVLALVPGLLAFVAGVRARHTPRPDLPPGNGKTLGTR